MKKEESKIRCALYVMRCAHLFSGARFFDIKKTQYASRNTHHGFTLIELMVAASILGLIGLAVLAAFGSGFHVYERVQSYGSVQADVLLLLEEMEGDLRNTFFSSAIAFEGDAQKISFPAVMEKIEMVEGEEKSVPFVGQRSYSLVENEGVKGIVGEKRNYGGAASAEGKSGQNAMLAVVNDLTFSYFLFDGIEKKYIWKNSWPAGEETLPAGVKIELTFQDGGREVPVVRTVLIPSVRVIDDREDDGEDGEEEGEAQGEV